ncbi:DNA-binding protein [Pseudomaricurvus alkylphenolicus]|uniref:Zn-ribbon domain-containing OB-fold protein n=1 Tax=Pseudomaricurvus alkylphenolicus TaxID=1306991 RepID=UPI0014206AEE|nr:OB-fold domain-containing protein [Pseudomaricurvus alkylphenolicus]NIB44104.1 DNA-binding protein [Pseudomaricurvus alkylphenolicus]
MSRKLPALTADTCHFWQGGAEGQLLIHFCPDCQRYFHPPSPVCPSCCSNRVGPKAVSGHGQIVSYTINYQQWNPTLDIPYVVAIVELDEQPGLRLLSNIVNCPTEQVSIGLQVRVCFERYEDIWLPLFEVQT